MAVGRDAKGATNQAISISHEKGRAHRIWKEEEEGWEANYYTSAVHIMQTRHLSSARKWMGARVTVPS